MWQLKWGFVGRKVMVKEIGNIERTRYGYCIRGDWLGISHILRNDKQVLEYVSSVWVSNVVLKHFAIIINARTLTSYWVGNPGSFYYIRWSLSRRLRVCCHNYKFQSKLPFCFKIIQLDAWTILTTRPTLKSWKKKLLHIKIPMTLDQLYASFQGWSHSKI